MKHTVMFTADVEVEVDEAKFTETFMAEFRKDFYPFNTIEDHLAHLAQLRVREIIPDGPAGFIEGYGEDMGISTRVGLVETEVLS